MKPRRFFEYLWFGVSILLNAVALINLQKDLFPALILWGEFVEKLAEIYASFRDLVIHPFQVIAGFFDLVIAGWVADILLVYCVLYSLLVLTIKKVERHYDAKVWDNAGYYVIGFLALPIMLFGFYYTAKNAESEEEKIMTKTFVRYVKSVAAMIVLLAFGNYLFRVA